MVSMIVGPHSPLGPTQQPDDFGLHHSVLSMTAMQNAQGSILDCQYKGSGKTDAETHMKNLTIALEARGFTEVTKNITPNELIKLRPSAPLPELSKEERESLSKSAPHQLVAHDAKVADRLELIENYTNMLVNERRNRSHQAGLLILSTFSNFPHIKKDLENKYVVDGFYDGASLFEWCAQHADAVDGEETIAKAEMKRDLLIEDVLPNNTTLDTFKLRCENLRTTQMKCGSQWVGRELCKKLR